MYLTSVFAQELQTSSYSKHECSAKDARRTKFHGRNRYADVSPCKCLILCVILFRMVCLKLHVFHIRGLFLSSGIFYIF